LKTVYLSLGSNLGDREHRLHEAIQALAAAGVRAARVSSVYETEPIGIVGQGWFLNIVVEAETELFPVQLLSRIRKIELALGRRRGIDKGPRTIDIDILFFGNFIIDTAKLTVPHLRAHERRFVLAPMAELAPEYRHPVMRRTMRELLGALSGQQVRKHGPASLLQ
jgi:2-amino-4-hydroxy-6-hydroxymethyldihydropteridine diphosphokinase